MADAVALEGSAQEWPLIQPFGDAALLITLGDRADLELTTRAGAIARSIEDARGASPGIGRAIPAHATVLIPFDPLRVERETALEVVARAVANAPAEPDSAARSPDRPLEIPVRYGGLDGPDLYDVADRHGLRPPDVIELHAGAVHRVLFLGFAPGFAYLGGLPAAIATPRRGTPRERVPAGSVGIAGEQTGVYPLAMPGGWNLIGRTDAVLFDASLTDPTPFVPGATVRFVPVR